MKISPRPAPHIHYHEHTRVIMGDVALSMLVIYGMCFYYYGVRVAVLMLTGIVSACLADVLCLAARGKKPVTHDISAVITGMMIPLMLPASIPLYVTAVAAVFGIFAAKHPFGGTGHNIFNPAAAGIAFVTVCFPSLVFSYPIPLELLPISPGADVVTAVSPAFTMMLGGIPGYDWQEMAFGNFPGPMGATNILVILTCLLYLVLRRAVRWQMPVVFIAVFCALCWIFPRGGMARFDTVLYEGMSGAVLFGSVFMLGDPVTSPARGWSKALYSAAAAAMVLTFRRWGRLEEEFAFVLLLMNAAVWGFDIIGEKIAGWIRRKLIETGTNKKIPKKTQL
ncbi:MAG: RnfABCDGE type electron transport complex subunit D [Oscillospiraceae bacterium]|nr:RnfABCDGE type electron transport complex subunit D [Oscillospiraceae bacterium]